MALNVGHDVIDLIGLDLGILPFVLLIVHGNNNKRLGLAFCDQVIQDICHSALIHPAQLIAVSIAGITMGQVQHLIRLGAVCIVASRQIHCQTMLGAVCTRVRYGLHGTTLVCIGLRQFHRAVCPSAGALLVGIIRDIDHAGQAADAGSFVDHRRIAGVVQTGNLVAVFSGHAEVINECTTGQRHLHTPTAIGKLFQLHIVGGVAVAACGSQTCRVVVRRSSQRSVNSARLAAGRIKQHKAVAVQFHLGQRILCRIDGQTSF